MINFVIFEGDTYMRDLYIKIIKKFLYTAHDVYHISEFRDYNMLTKSKLQHLEGKRIYLINTEIPGIDGFDLARQIRTNGDLTSPIIMISQKGKKYSIKKSKFAMILNVVEQNDKLIPELLKSIEEAYRITTIHSTLTFSFFDEIYRVPYDDIYYIEKNLNDDTITVNTKDDTYTDYTSIKRLHEKLKDDPRFFKCHRSCIVNLYKVASYNCKDNIITFDNGTTLSMISRDFKPLLAKRLIRDKISE